MSLIMKTCVLMVAALFAAPVMAGTSAAPQGQTSLQSSLQLSLKRYCFTGQRSVMRACFDEGGGHFDGRLAGQISLQTIAFGRVGNLQSVNSMPPRRIEGGVMYERQGFNEKWQIVENGFEQFFTIEKRPSGQGRLVFVLDVDRATLPNVSGSVDGKINYDSLAVVDATGHPIPAELEQLNGHIRISVNDSQAVYPLVIDPRVWMQQEVVAENISIGQSFGWSVDISGNTAFVGKPGVSVNGHSGQGRVFIYKRTDEGWVFEQKITDENGVAEKFGSSVAVNGDIAIIGAQATPPLLAGSAYVFARDNGHWKQVQKLTPRKSAMLSLFGFSVALDDDTAFVGAAGATVDGNLAQGATYVFKRGNGQWQQVQKLVEDNGESNDSFGNAVAIDGNTALVAARCFHTPSDSPCSEGRVYVYHLFNGQWQQSQVLDAGDAFAFGYSVALNGDKALIGANGYAMESGAAYVFSASGGHWSMTGKLEPRDGSWYDSFGSSVALDGDKALVGSTWQSLHGDKQALGGAYLFTHEAGTWTQTAKIVANNGMAGGLFGYAVALQGSHMLVGAPQKDIEGHLSQGAAYFFDAATLELDLNAPEVVEQGQTYASTTFVTNSGTTTAPAVALTMSIPEAAKLVSISASQGGCTTSGFRMIACKLGTIKGNAETAKASMTLKVTGEPGAAVKNTATVSNAAPHLGVAMASSVNHVPVARDGKIATSKNTSVTGIFQASDENGESLVFSIVTQPSHGEVTIKNAQKGVYVYTPERGYAGGDSFTFEASDGHSDSNAATVVVNIKNHTPVARNGSLMTDKNTPADGTLKASDPDGGSLVFSIVTPPGNGTVTVNAKSGAFTYTPKPGYYGQDSFGFKVSDGQASSNEATVGITVKGSAPPGKGGSGGGGSFGSLLLILLASLTAAVAVLRSARRQRQPGKKRKGSSMRLDGKWAMIIACAVSLLMATVQFAPSAVAAQTRGQTALTQRSIANANRAGMPGSLVKMAPQSSLGLLSRATKLGPYAPKATIELTIGLKLHNVAKLKSFLQQVQNPYSPLYHQWLTPREFTARYGPTKADVARVVRFLKSQGIRIEDVSANRMLIHTEATTVAYERAFEIRINDYRFRGRRFYSTENRPALPRALAPLVTNILGLNHGVQLHPYSYFEPASMMTRASGSLQAPPASLTNLNPLQIATAYNVPDITDANHASDINIAIITAVSPDVAQNNNYSRFWAAFGLPDHRVNVINVGGPSGTGGAGETTLDIEYSGAMGPGATLNVYVVADTHFDTFTDAYNQFVVDNTSAVMSTSWGLYESGTGQSAIQADEQIFMQAAAQGITMFAAAGDNGAADNGPGLNNADYPASSAYVTAANGTQLTISDLSGTYGSEVVWNDSNCFSNGPMSTGGAISEFIDKPAWQAGPGVPTDIDMRMDSDVALTASCSHPMLVLQDGSWYVTAGTSAVAPQLAGIFAQIVDVHGERFGIAGPLLYGVVNGGHYASDFHDVTEGCNGKLPDGSDSCAETGWDHPTGWGSLNVKNLITHIGIVGPKGTLSGAVTAAASGSVIAGATIMAVPASGTSARSFSEKSQADGSYSMLLPVGSFKVTVSKFGFQKSATTVTIAKDNTTTQDFALEAVATVKLSGKVTDGSGHGYGLYASIKVFSAGVGQVAGAWTDPTSGQYSVELPKGEAYTLKVVAAFNGYQPGSKSVTLSADKTRNFSLKVASACTAPGYVLEGISADFNSGTFPPSGWAATTPTSNDNVVWKLASQLPSNSGNYTGGTGDAAATGSGLIGNPGGDPYDTSLVTPPISVTSLHGATQLFYKATYIAGTPPISHDALDLGISTDGGTTWTRIKHWTANHGTVTTPPSNPDALVQQVNLGSYLPGSGAFKLRWRYHGTGYGFYAQIDGMILGRCAVIPGGLIAGQVTDGNTGEGLVGATITDESGTAITTISNSADPGLPAGTYVFFERQGEHALTASQHGYQSNSVSLQVAKNSITTRNFALKAGRLSVQPDTVKLDAKVNSVESVPLVVRNTGSVKAHYEIAPINAQPFSKEYSNGSFAALPYYPEYKDLSTLAVKGYDDGLIPSIVSSNRAMSRAAGELVSNFKVTIQMYGLGVDHNGEGIWLSSPDYATLEGDAHFHQFLFNGTSTGRTLDMSQLNILYMADMAFNDRTDTLWALSIDAPQGSSSRVIELDPDTLLPTGRSIPVPSPQSERGLAYDPMTNTWYAGDFNSQTIYHFDAEGTLLDSVNVGLDVLGLAYNATTGHLFVLANNGADAVYVFDAQNGYAPLRSFSIPGFDPNDAGAGLGYDCDGNLWISGFKTSEVWQVKSGESGWCNVKDIPWLTMAPAEGTVDTAASNKVMLAINGRGQKGYTTSHAYLRVDQDTPYPPLMVPMTIHWQPQPVDLQLSGAVSTPSPHKGDTVLYTVTVLNHSAANHGKASQTELAITLPAGLKFVAASGDAKACTSANGQVTCTFGTLALGDSKTETIAAKAVKAGEISSTFEVSAREPESDGGNNHLALTVDVAGSSDLSLKAGSLTFVKGDTGSLVFTIGNVGPDAAAGVVLHARASSEVVAFKSASASQGSCSVAGGSLSCDLGEAVTGHPITVTLTVAGVDHGIASVNAQVSSVADDVAPNNNGTNSTVTVNAKSSGGGSFGWLVLAMLAMLLGLAIVTDRAQRRHSMHR